MLETFVIQKIPVRIALPSPSTRNFTPLVKMIGELLAFRRSALTYKEVYIFIPNIHIGKHHSERMMGRIGEALRLAGPFVKVCPYTLSEGQILNANRLGLVRMRFRLKDRDWDCSTLNSFIFKC